MPLVAVAPNRHAYGVDCDRDDWRHRPGDDRNSRQHRSGKVGVACAYEVLDLTNALAREYRSDAHLVAYLLRDPRGAPARYQPRINKPGLSFVRGLGYSITIEVLFADIDNPGHVPWTDELRAAARETDRQLATAGVYYSANGRRIVQPLTRAVEVDESERAELVIAAWLRELAGLGIHADEGCQDWTRHFRLPHVRRDGKALARSEHVDLARMVPIDPPAPAKSLLGRRRPRRRATELVRAGDVGPAPLARAFEVAGLLGPALGRDKVAVVCPFAAWHSMGRDFDTSTVLFGPTPSAPIGWWHCSHNSCAGRTQDDVIAELPPEARALVEAALSSRNIDTKCQIPSRNIDTKCQIPSREVVPPDEARVRLERAFRSAPDGLSVVVAGCGTGKTEAAIAVACERAELGGTRRTPHTKTSISVPTTKLSIEVAERLRARGALVRRVFGPLSMRRADGKPECAIYECAAAFSRGGLSVPWELCEGRGKVPCEHAKTCKARGGVDGPEEARIVVGPHKLLSRLSAAAGKTGLLVIDEPPPLLAHEVVTPEELVRTAQDLRVYFESRYASALDVSLRAIAAWIATGPLDKPGPLAAGVARVDAKLLEIATAATGADNAVDAARAAFVESDEPRVSDASPVQRQFVYVARHSFGIATAIGHASRVARIVWTALTCEPGGAVARIEERGGRRVLVVTMPDVQLRESMRREGSVVVADAGARQHLPIYRLVVGYDPPVTEAHAADGVGVRRVHLRRRATRSGWLRHGRLEIDPSLVRAVELAVGWLREEPARKAALVTFRVVELALRGALGEDVGAAWSEAGQTAEVLEEARRRFAPILRRLPCSLDLGHYGALRGLDHWREHDALVTLGDPWPQLADARYEGELLRLCDWEGRLELAARAELEQAHGRLRTVHRTTPCRALHVGALLPGGWNGPEIVSRGDEGGRQRAVSADAVREAVRCHGSVSAAAKALGVARSTVRRLNT